MNRPRFTIDDTTYRAMLAGLNSLYRTDRPGRAADSYFLYRDNWLPDTAVAERLVKRRGQFQVYLVFAYAHDPFRFLSRYITTCVDQRRAGVMAHYLRRQAAKDQRGTISLREDQWPLPPN
jgi:hypothetical protein